MYTRRNSFESSGQHWCVFVASLVATWLAWGASDASFKHSGTLVTLGLLLANALAVTVHSQRAVYTGQKMQETMGWE
jgi:hypothetical protein